MLGRLFLLMTLVPALEVWLLIQLGAALGPWTAFALVIGTGAAGAFLARAEGRRTLREVQETLARGEIPEEGVLGGLMVFAGGILLVTPGVLTDFVGLSLLTRPLRRALLPVVKRRLVGRVKTLSIGSSASAGSSFTGVPFGGFTPSDPPAEGGLIDVEAIQRED